MPFCTSFIDAKVLSCRRQEVFKTYELWDSLNDLTVRSALPNFFLTETEAGLRTTERKREGVFKTKVI